MLKQVSKKPVSTMSLMCSCMSILWGILVKVAAEILHKMQHVKEQTFEMCKYPTMNNSNNITKSSLSQITLSFTDNLNTYKYTIMHG